MAKLHAGSERRFSAQEFAARVEKARSLMTEAKIDALLVTSEYNFRYLTGFVSQFWLSPTRPWYFILPLDGEPVAIISEVGVVCFKETSWVTRYETWPSPRQEDEGVSLVSAALSRIKSKHGHIGAELGPESRLGIPVTDFLTIRDRISPTTFVDGTWLINQLRMVKSTAEVERIRFACQGVCDGFDAVPTLYVAGDTEEVLARKLHAHLIMQGIDKVPYMVGAAGPGGYRSTISNPANKRIEGGDVLIIDTGSTYDGYYCDFDRNWGFGFASDAARKAHEILWQATEAGIKAARPGARACDLWQAQFSVLEPAGESKLGARMGHAIGMQLTEPPSIKPDDKTLLVPGMVMTIEPGLMYGDGRVMLHEENLVITESGCELLTRRAPRELPIIPH